MGLSNHSAGQLDVAERIGHVDSLQPPFSAIYRNVARDELPWAAAHQTAVIVSSPMQAGFLTGAFTKERAASLSRVDWRSRSQDFAGDCLVRNLALTAALRPSPSDITPL